MAIVVNDMSESNNKALESFEFGRAFADNVTELVDMFYS